MTHSLVWILPTCGRLFWRRNENSKICTCLHNLNSVFHVFYVQASTSGYVCLRVWVPWM